MTLEMLKHDCREEGREEGRKEKRNKTIMNMLRRGLSEDLIADVADTTIDEVRRIKEQL